MAPSRITGLILAGGRGSRMGGVDKGLQALHGMALVDHAIARLRPQVGPLLINANRHHDDYARRGLPVVADADAGFAGPLAGLLAGLRAAPTEWLLSVPCDVPRLPPDLAERLAAAGGTPAVPRTADGRLQPVFCLLHRDRAKDLAAFLAEGGRRMEDWLRKQGFTPVRFDRPGDTAAFFNANSAAELQSLQDHD